MLARILTPAPVQNQDTPRISVLLLLVASAVSLAVAPWLMPDGYSWIANTTSESAAQGIEGAWLARSGFLAFGLAVLWIATSLRAVWARGAVWMHVAFGICMIATAAFSHQPWLDGVLFDPVEDLLHSVTATAMGFAFAFGVLARLLQRTHHGRTAILFHVVALLAATVIPMLMAYLPDVVGLLQRLMFLIAYLWYAREALPVR